MAASVYDCDSFTKQLAAAGVTKSSSSVRILSPPSPKIEGKATSSRTVQQQFLIRMLWSFVREHSSDIIKIQLQVSHALHTGRLEGRNIRDYCPENIPSTTVIHWAARQNTIISPSRHRTIKIRSWPTYPMPRKRNWLLSPLGPFPTASSTTPH